MFLCCPISAASGSHFLLAANHSAFILTVFRRCEGNTFSSCRPSYYCLNHQIIPAWFPRKFSILEYKLYYLINLIQKWRCIPAISHHVSTFCLSSSMPTSALALSISPFAFLPIPPNPIVWSAVLIPNRIMRLIYAILFLVFSFYSA